MYSEHMRNTTVIIDQPNLRIVRYKSLDALDFIKKTELEFRLQVNAKYSHIMIDIDRETALKFFYYGGFTLEHTVSDGRYSLIVKADV